MAYLPGVEVNHDHEGGSSRMRLSHCTSGQLTPTMVSNVDHLNAQFLLVGDCVRAIPLLSIKQQISPLYKHLNILTVASLNQDIEGILTIAVQKQRSQWTNTTKRLLSVHQKLALLMSRLAFTTFTKGRKCKLSLLVNV